MLHRLSLALAVWTRRGRRDRRREARAPAHKARLLRPGVILDDPDDVGSAVRAFAVRRAQRAARTASRRSVAGASRRDLVQGASAKAAAQHPVEAAILAETLPREGAAPSCERFSGQKASRSDLPPGDIGLLQVIKGLD